MSLLIHTLIHTHLHTIYFYTCFPPHEWIIHTNLGQTKQKITRIRKRLYTRFRTHTHLHTVIIIIIIIIIHTHTHTTYTRTWMMWLNQQNFYHHRSLLSFFLYKYLTNKHTQTHTRTVIIIIITIIIKKCAGTGTGTMTTTHVNKERPILCCFFSFKLHDEFVLMCAQ